MDEGRQKDLQLLEEIIDKGLKQKLVHATASRYSNLPPLFSLHAISFLVFMFKFYSLWSLHLLVFQGQGL